MPTASARTIAGKIGLVMVAFSVLTCALIGMGSYGVETNDSTVQGVLNNQSKALYLASAAQERAARMHQRAFEVLVETDKSNWAPLQAAFVDECDAFTKTVMEMRSVLDDGDLELYDTLKPDAEKYRAAEVQTYALQQGGKRAEAEDHLQGEVSTVFARLNAHLETLVSQQVQDLAAAGVSVHDTSNRTLLAMIATGFVGLVLTATGAFLLVRAHISRPLTSMTQVMTRLAAGDTTVEVPAVGRKDEIGSMAAAVLTFKTGAIAKLALEQDAAEARRGSDAERARAEAERATIARQQTTAVEGIATALKHLADGDLLFRLEEPFAADYETLRADFNAAITKLQDTMSVVAGTTSAIQSGTVEISSAAEDLSRRTEQQAASLEETAAALDEITATVKKTAGGASQASAVVTTARSDAEQSGAIVGRAVEAMGAIETSSQKIGQIIGVIDEIAFQTNLLALNAGVEAARAGEAGRGFAVVASEVRALAQRSAEAAKEIKALISTSANQVGDGVELVGETGKALRRIVDQVAQVATIVTEIAASAQEQSAALEQVNTAINQMDQVTQQNAGMVEETTAASRTLAGETEELSRLVGQFRVGAAARGSTARHDPVRAVKTVGHGGAARKPVAQEASWDEF